MLFANLIEPKAGLSGGGIGDLDGWRPPGLLAIGNHQCRVFIDRRRAEYGQLAILHGVKHCSDLIWGDCYEHWAVQPDTQVLLAADACDTGWAGTIGPVTRLFEQLAMDRSGAYALLCGPEAMLRACAEQLLQDGMAAERIWLSLERNMHCALGQCGHCQLGEHFLCRDGPVFHYAQVRHLLDKPGL